MEVYCKERIYFQGLVPVAVKIVIVFVITRNLCSSPARKLLLRRENHIFKQSKTSFLTKLTSFHIMNDIMLNSLVTLRGESSSSKSNFTTLYQFPLLFVLFAYFLRSWHNFRLIQEIPFKRRYATIRQFEQFESRTVLREACRDNNDHDDDDDYNDDDGNDDDHHHQFFFFLFLCLFRFSICFSLYPYVCVIFISKYISTLFLRSATQPD